MGSKDLRKIGGVQGFKGGVKGVKECIGGRNDLGPPVFLSKPQLSLVVVGAGGFFGGKCLSAYCVLEGLFILQSEDWCFDRGKGLIRRSF